MSDFIEKIVGDLGEKKRWKQYRARVAGAQGHDASVQIWEDLADLFEQAAADGTSVRVIVGEDPVAFADAFAANYGTKDWRTKAQRRLREAIDDIAQNEPTS